MSRRERDPELGSLSYCRIWGTSPSHVVLSDGFGTLEGLAAFFTTILVGRHVFPPWQFRSNSSYKITLPQFNTAMPHGRIGIPPLIPYGWIALGILILGGGYVIWWARTGTHHVFAYPLLFCC